MRKHIESCFNISWRGVLIILVIVYAISVLVGGSPVIAQSFTQNDANSVIDQTPFYDPNASQCSGTTGVSLTLQGTAAWNSNTQPPYYLEEYIINILKDIASVTNTPQSTTVTQEHVVAMVAWAWAEGGNIANTGADFNIWNMGFLKSYPQLFIGGTGHGDGTQTGFVSFDAGVQGNTVEMTGSNENRIAKILTQPGSTAEQFMQTLTNYQNYPGNHPWAEADDPNNGGNQQQYLEGLLADLQQARGSYAQEASVEIGPGQENTARVPASELQYGGGSSNSGTTSGGNSCSGTPATTPAGQCQNPFRDIPNLRPERIDQGVDYAGSGPVYAICPGTILNTTNLGWDYGGFDAYISIKIAGGQYDGLVSYMAEGCPPTVSVGQQVTTSTVICNLINPSSTGIETGWSAPAGNGQPIAQLYGGNGCCSTTAGVSYNNFLKSLGTPSGILTNPPIGTPLPSPYP